MAEQSYRARVSRARAWGAVERSAHVVDSQGAIVDCFHTRSGAEFAAHSLNIGASHVEPHRTLGSRVQPGAPREVVEQRARELGAVIARHQEAPSFTEPVHRATLHRIGRS